MTAIHSLTLRSQITDGGAGRVLRLVERVRAPVLLHRQPLHLLPRLLVAHPAPGLHVEVKIEDGPEAGHVPLKALHRVPDEDERDQSGRHGG